MKRLTFLIFGLVACTSQTPNQTGLIPAGTASRGFDPDGDGSPDGTQYDLDGDGTFDAVDVDGDGILDGGDFDGDGVVTVFTQLATGGSQPTQEQLDAFPEDVDPDFDAELGGDGKMDGPGGVMTQPSVDLSAFMPRPANQGTLGSCAAFAVAAVATAYRGQRGGVDPNTVWASPQFLYARQLKTAMGKCDDGTYMDDGLATLVVEGATPHARLPYNDKMCAMDPAAEDANEFRIGSFEALKPFTRDKVKEVLSKGTPIVFGVTLPPNFTHAGGAQAKQPFKSDDGQLGGKHGGGHAMVIIGYDDARSAYRILNSWGADWGDGGYIWWDYDDLDKRAGLHGFSVASYSQLPPPPAAIGEPDLKLESSAAIAVRTGSGDRLIAKVTANGPLLIQGVALDEQPADTREQFLAFGNLSARAAAPLAAGPHKLTVTGRIASGLTPERAKTEGAAFTRVLMVNVGEPVSDPDGRL
jgi:hypothetical protein